MSGKLLVIYFIGFLLVACKTESFFQARKYYGGGATWEFYPDNTYQYLEKMEGGYVYKFSKGTWRQEDKKVFLFNDVSDPGELRANIRISQSGEPETQLVVNILPKKNLRFAYLPGAMDFLSVELVVDRIVYPLKNETNIIRLQKSSGTAYFRVYPKPDIERTSEVLNDTLRSQHIDLNGMESKILSIDLDANPYYLAQIKMPNDTLRIVNERKIKWKNIDLERPR